MSTLVLNRDSLSVKLEANHLLIHDHAGEGRFQRVPLVDIDRVVDYPIGLVAREKIRELGKCQHSKPVLTRVF